MERNDVIWKDAGLSRTFLESVRGAIPLASEQIAVMLKVLKGMTPHVERVLDLGCGDGILGRSILAAYPAARAVLVDFSDAMLDVAKKQTAADSRSAFIKQDFGERSWVGAVSSHAPFDVIVSGFAIHHQKDARKHQLYAEVYDLLRPGGIFLNLEHVASPTKRLEDIFETTFVDSLHAYHRRRDPAISRERIAAEFYNRSDKKANILASVDTQCGWLREIGYEDVDCYFKIFELALFGGRKPEK